MAHFEIYWDDLNKDAKKRLRPLYHENVDLTPLAIVNVEEEDDNREDNDITDVDYEE